MMKAGFVLLVLAATTLAGCNDKYPEVDWSRVVETPQDPPLEQLRDWMERYDGPGALDNGACFLADHRSGPHWNSTTDRPYRVGDVDHYTAAFYYPDYRREDPLIGGSIGIYGAFRLVKGTTNVTYDGPREGPDEGWFYTDFYVQAWRTGEAEISMWIDTTYGPTPVCYLRLFDVEA